ncbi:MAG: ribonuclease HI family protein [Gemmataceae bacterium]|nr:ribonuclease HI family protein [Gemmataceae bacterium]
MIAHEVTVYTDGASRGNPGPAAAAFVVLVDDVQVLEFSEPIGKTTNNVAEYTAMIRALECCRKLQSRRVHLHSDSELMVKQMRGEYKVRHPDILPLYEEARDLVSQFDHVSFTHVPRAENAEADRLGNEALDGRPVPLPSLDGRHVVERTPAPPADERPDADYLAILGRARDAWARGSDVPEVDDVWKQILSKLKQDRRLRDGKASASGGRKKK